MVPSPVHFKFYLPRHKGGAGKAGTTGRPTGGSSQGGSHVTTLGSRKVCCLPVGGSAHPNLGLLKCVATHRPTLLPHRSKLWLSDSRVTLQISPRLYQLQGLPTGPCASCTGWQ